MTIGVGSILLNGMGGDSGSIITGSVNLYMINIYITPVPTPTVTPTPILNDIGIGGGGYNPSYKIVFVIRLTKRRIVTKELIVTPTNTQSYIFQKIGRINTYIYCNS